MQLPDIINRSRADLLDYIFIVLGMALYAIGFTVFILPHDIVVGGMAGFGTLVYFASGERIPVAVTMYVVNILMLVCWHRVLGRKFVIGTVFGASVLSLMIGSIEQYFTSHAPVVTDMTMSVILGAVLCGCGIGLYYAHKGSAGGTDIVAAVFEKKSNMSIGRTMMVIDMTIVACSFFLPFDGDMDARIQSRVQTIVYGLVSIVIYSFLANYIVNADKQTIQFLILSPRWHEIADNITHRSGRGVTTFDGRGFWTGEERTMLVVWCRQYDADRIYDIVREIDEGAYIIQSEARSVYGNGFDPLSHKRRKKNLS
ncbi:MAG: YitT family protein [Bacteroidales bacterium]|nr:YitT family protein [Bacteroidales bacterium]